MSGQSSAPGGEPPASRFAGATFVVLAAALWGLWPVWVRGASGGTETAVVAQLVGGLLGLPWAIREGRRRTREGARRATDARGLAWVTLVGVCNAANTYFYFRALDEGAVAPAALSHYLAPVFLALAAPFVLGEPRSSRTPAALVLALAGTAALLLATPSGGAGAAGAASTRHAVVLGASSAIFYASATLAAKFAALRWSDAELFSYQALIAAVVSIPLLGVSPPGPAWLYPSLGGLFSTVIPGLLFYAGLRRLPAERVGVLTYVEVLAGVLVGWAAFGERPGVGALVGGVCILVAGVHVVTAPRVTG